LTFDKGKNVALAVGLTRTSAAIRTDILFNHKSSIRGETFVTRKITRALARIGLGLQDCLVSRRPGRASRLRPRNGLRPRYAVDVAEQPTPRKRSFKPGGGTTTSWLG